MNSAFYPLGCGHVDNSPDRRELPTCPQPRRRWSPLVKTQMAPAGLPPLSRAMLTEWLAPHQPVEPLRYDLRWTYQTQQGSAKGRAAVVFVPPDSVRFDYRAPFGRSGAAVSSTPDLSNPRIR